MNRRLPSVPACAVAALVSALCLSGCWPNTGARSWRNNPRPAITGQITAEGRPLPGATVAVNNVSGDATAITDIRGTYTIHVPFGWSGILTPQHGDYEFTPKYITLDEVMSDRADVDLTASRKQTPIRTAAPPTRQPGIDEDCIIDRDCDDGVYCNGYESCLAGRCRAGDPPCDAALTCDEGTHRCVACLADDDCDDDVFCNGSETCTAGRCANGTSPCPENLFCDESAARCIEREHGVVAVSLIDADTNQPVRNYADLQDDNALDLVGLPRLALGATTHPATVGSVRFALSRDGQLIEDVVRNTPPYALYGAPDGNYTAWPQGAPPPGSYELTVTPYTEADGAGTVLAARTVHLTIKSPPECSRDEDCDDKRYCNGAEACVEGRCLAGEAPCSEDEACDERRDRCQMTCADNSECDDGLYCNGRELCVANVCAVGTPPCPATLVCNEAAGACEAPPAKVYYVDDDGQLQPQYDSAADQGSINNPFRSMRHAANVVAPGDTVIVRAGTYLSSSTKQSEPLLVIETSGTAEAPITFKAADGERVVISGASGTLNTLIEVNAAYVDIEGFELTGARRVALVIRGPGSHHVNVRLCHAHHNDYDSNWIGAAFRTIGPVEDILFEDCLSHHNAGGFQLKDGANKTVAAATVPPAAGNDGFEADLPEAQWSMWPGWDFSARRVTLRRCIAHDNTLNEEHTDGFGARYAVECILEDSISFRNVDDNVDFIGATRCIVRRNIVFAADPDDTPNGDGNGIKIGVRGGLDSIAHHNISFGNRRGGIDMADTERAQVYNNTCVNNQRWFGIWFEAGRSRQGIRAQNNICAGNPKGDIGLNSGTHAETFDHNLVSDSNRHNQRHSPGRGGLKGTDPLFTSSDLEIDTQFSDDMSIRDRLDHIRTQVYEKVRLQVGSPAVDAGIVVPGITPEYLGKGPDMGAVESH